MSQSQALHVNNLFQAAHDDGMLSGSSLQALNSLDLGAEIQAGLGVSVNHVHASEVVLVTMMVDDSGSIRFAGNAKAVREGHNLVLDALLNTKQSTNILVHTCYLNGHVLFPYQPLAIVDPAAQQRSGHVSYIQNPDVKRMDSRNYNPNMGTPLYDQTVVLLGRVLAKYQEFADNGVMARTITLLITDGDDQHSQRAKAATVKSLVDDLVGERHIVAGMGINDGHTDFRTIFEDMGIRPEWVLTPGHNLADIRQAFQVFSQSAVRASQGAARFSQTAAGGFGSP